jgi:6-phosphogluconolactonase
MKALNSALHRTVLIVVMVGLLMFVLGGNAFAQEESEGGGVVYVLTNQLAGNTVAVLHRSEDGTLTRMQEVSTGGLGSGPGPLPPQFPPGPGPDPLNSADALISTNDGRFVLAVNPRSNDLSVLAVTHNGLRLVDKVPSGGVFPVSVTSRNGLVYVLNQGQSPTNSVQGTANITGFFLDRAGKLHGIPNSTRVIGQPGSAPGEVALSPDGDMLIVAETLANLIDVFQVGDDGLTGDHVSFPSNNRTPLAIAFTHHHVLAITEGDELVPQTGTPHGSSTSTYRITDDNTLEPISKAVGNNQTATCWIRFTRNGRFAYTGNTGTGNLSSYRVSPGGELSLLAGVAIDTGRASVPIDLDITRDGKYLYVLASLAGKVQGYRIEEDGSLTPVASLGGFPISMQGIVAH